MRKLLNLLASDDAKFIGHGFLIGITCLLLGAPHWVGFLAAIATIWATFMLRAVLENKPPKIDMHFLGDDVEVHEQVINPSDPSKNKGPTKLN